MRRNWRKIVLFFYALFAPAISLANGGGGTVPAECNPKIQICNPLTGSATIQAFIHNLLTNVLKVGIPVVALAVIYCGFLFVKARGNSEKLSEAKSALLYTLIGAAVLLGSWTIAELISSTVQAL